MFIILTNVRLLFIYLKPMSHHYCRLTSASPWLVTILSILPYTVVNPCTLSFLICRGDHCVGDCRQITTKRSTWDFLLSDVTVYIVTLIVSLKIAYLIRLNFTDSQSDRWISLSLSLFIDKIWESIPHPNPCWGYVDFNASLGHKNRYSTDYVVITSFWNRSLFRKSVS